MKQQIINQIKSELHMLEVSSLPHEFEKHLYAAETLIDVLKDQKPAAKSGMVSKDVEEKTVMTEKDEKMLELMGGRAKEGRTPTDEGKNDSIFDF
ncbi:MAG TPA: YwdI family protein [Candidatus Salinicoccus merdavium]|nr:YwdI family protein [Candidatus Salinicoccus merdavium]